MVKNKDWNEAFIGNEDWKAAMDSEIFRSFVSRALIQEQEEIKKEADEALIAAAAGPKPINSAQDAFDLIKQAAELEELNSIKEFNPMRSNFDYDKYGEYFEGEPVKEDDEVDELDEGYISPNDVDIFSDEVDDIEQEAILTAYEEELGLLKNAYYLASKEGK